MPPKRNSGSEALNFANFRSGKGTHSLRPETQITRKLVVQKYQEGNREVLVCVWSVVCWQ